MTLTTLVTGAGAAQREAAIAAALDPALTTALILEGIPSGHSPLDTASGLRVARIAPGCPCCSGNMTMRVTLNRLLPSGRSGFISALPLPNIWTAFVVS